MSTCRVVFAKGKQKEFLMHAKQLSRLNWERFASDIGVSSYNVLRTTYLNERNTLPITVPSQSCSSLRPYNLVEFDCWLPPCSLGTGHGRKYLFEEMARCNAQETEVIS